MPLCALSRCPSVSTSVCLGEEKRWVPWSAIRITQTKSAGFGNKNSKTAPRTEIRNVRVSWKKNALFLNIFSCSLFPERGGHKRRKSEILKRMLSFDFRKKCQQSVVTSNSARNCVWTKKTICCVHCFALSSANANKIIPKQIGCSSWLSGKEGPFREGTFFYPFFHLHAM